MGTHHIFESDFDCLTEIEMGMQTYVIKVANLAITTKEEDIKHMFGYIGRIEDCQMYPRNVSLMPVPTKVAFVKFRHRRDAAVALHLTNSILVDKCIQVIPWRQDEMPTEAVALQSLFPGQSLGHAHQAQQNLESALSNAGLPAAPTIPQFVDGEIREQIQRTIHVKGINPQVTTNASLLEFMQEHAGEVKYSTFAGEGDFVEECEAYIEFADIKGVIGALKLEDPKIDEKNFTVEMARCAILKSTLKPKTPAEAAIEIAEALKASKDGRLASDYYGTPTGNSDPETQKELDEKRKKDRKRRSRSKKRSRSRKRSRKRSRSRKRNRSRSRDRRRRSRSGSRSKKSRKSKRSRSRDRKREKSREKEKSEEKETKMDTENEAATENGAENGTTEVKNEMEE